MSIEAIHKTLTKHGVSITEDSPVLLHRTNAVAAGKILKSGFNTEIQKYGMISSVATVHSDLHGADFRENLDATHAGSTHNLAILIPAETHARLNATLSEHGIAIRPNQTIDVAAKALSGVLPKEWVIGTYNQTEKLFKPNGKFNPNYTPEFTDVAEVVRELQSKRRRPRFG